MNAIKEIASITGTFRDHLTQWLASAENGITDFFAERVGSTCVTVQQLAAIAAAGAPGSGAGDAGTPAAVPPGGTSGPSTITINGANSATSTPSAANDNEPIVHEVAEPEPDGVAQEQDAAEPTPPEPQAANDNKPVVELPATGTE